MCRLDSAASSQSAILNGPDFAELVLREQEGYKEKFEYLWNDLCYIMTIGPLNFVSTIS